MRLSRLDFRALKTRLSGRLEIYHRRLAAFQADGVLALLGLLTGLVSGVIIVLFRYAVILIQQAYLPGMSAEAFESLGPWMRFGLPSVGGLLIGIVLWRLPASARTVGVVHVLERLQYHQGHMPALNFLVQFFGGALALATGQSVGREGPSVHLGAAAASLMGRRLGIPDNSLRTLIACGAAAAIAASFNTPLAGVVFAMEVVMAEYTIAGFVPVILAAVSATAVSHAVFGADTAFIVPHLGLGSKWELGYIALMGVMVGLSSAAFVRLVGRAATLAGSLHIVARMAACGGLVGVLGVLVPETLGLGYDTVDLVLAGKLGFSLMFLIFVAKFCATGLCVAARMPGGLIGPTMVLGSLAGGCFAVVVSGLPGYASSSGLYAMLGMAAMMAAMLRAPLAALLALLELTGNPLIILPGMMAVVSAALAANRVFGQDSIFVQMLRDAGLDLRHDPVAQSLRRVGVAAVMNRNIEQAERHVDAPSARELLVRGPQWVVVENAGKGAFLLRAADLARYCASDGAVDEMIDLAAVPAERLEARPVHLQATLLEAREIMNRETVEALYVQRPVAPMTYRVFGVLLRADLESSYLFRT